MRVAAESWYALCEQLAAPFTYSHPLPPLTFRPKFVSVALDTIMADTPRVSTPHSGMKRSREDEGEDVVWDLEIRAEKVSVNINLNQSEGIKL